MLKHTITHLPDYCRKYSLLFWIAHIPEQAA